MASEDFDRETLREQKYPWRDEELMYRLYEEEEMSAVAISEEFGCSSSTILTWLGKHDSIDKRSRREAVKLKSELDYVPLKQSTHGYEVWWERTGQCYVHQLLAVAEYGPHALHDSSNIHHKNDIPWDNRPSNLEIMTRGDHSGMHSRKLSWLDELRIAEQYRSTDCSTYDLAEHYPVTPGAIARVARRFDLT